MKNLEYKIARAKDLIRETIEFYGVNKFGISSSFGKDSMVVTDLAKKVDPTVPVRSIMTPYKFQETFKYMVDMRNMYLMDGPFNVYITANQISVPPVIRDAGIDVAAFPELYGAASEIIKKIGKGIYKVTDLEKEILSKPELKKDIDKIKELSGIDIYKMASEGKSGPDLCCGIFKVYPQKVATRDLDAWATGLRNTEGRTRVDYKEVENLDPELLKLNPILTFTESEILSYLEREKIPIHPLYGKELPDGRRYRSLGCEPCTQPILPTQQEREGRWAGTSKCGGECGIHTQPLRESHSLLEQKR